MKIKEKILSILKWGALLGGIISIIEIVKNHALQIDINAYNSVINLSLILLVVWILYLGIKEIRDHYSEGVISYAKAFGIGFSIILVSFLIVTIVLTILFSTQPKYLQNINAKNEKLYYQNLQNDSITTTEIEQFLLNVDDLVVKNQKIVAIEQNFSEHDSLMIDSSVLQIKKYFHGHIKNGYQIDSTQYRLGNFNSFAKRSWIDFFERGKTNKIFADTLLEPLTKIFILTAQEMDSINILDQRFETTKSQKVFKHTHAMTSAIMFSFSLIIYGLLCNLFVALYLFRKKQAPLNNIDSDSNENIDQNCMQDNSSNVDFSDEISSK